MRGEGEANLALAVCPPALELSTNWSLAVICHDSTLALGTLTRVPQLGYRRVLQLWHCGTSITIHICICEQASQFQVSLNTRFIIVSK